LELAMNRAQKPGAHTQEISDLVQQLTRIDARLQELTHRQADAVVDPATKPYDGTKYALNCSSNICPLSFGRPTTGSSSHPSPARGRRRRASSRAGCLDGPFPSLWRPWMTHQPLSLCTGQHLRVRQAALS